MSPEQMSIVPMQAVAKILATTIQGTVPMIIGTAGLAVAGIVYGGIKATKAISSSSKKPKAGENKASKIHGTEGKIKSYTVDKELFEKFEPLAKKQGIAFSSCKTDNKTNFIYNEKDYDLVKQLMDSCKKSLVQENKIETKISEPQEVPVEKSKIYEIASDTLDTVLERLKDDLGSIVPTGDGYVISFNNDKLIDLENKISNLKSELQPLAKPPIPPIEVPLSKAQAIEALELYSNMVFAQKNSPSLTFSERLQLAVESTNNLMENSGIAAHGFVENNELKLKINGEDIQKFSMFAKNQIKSLSFIKAKDKTNEVSKETKVSKISKEAEVSR